jgi:hypothetical protein
MKNLFSVMAKVAMMAKGQKQIATIATKVFQQ